MMRKRWFIWLCIDGGIQGVEVPWGDSPLRDFIYKHLELDYSIMWVHARTFDGAKQQAKEYFTDMFLTGVWQ